MNIYKCIAPAQDGYFWYKAPNVQPCIARVTTPASDLRCDADPNAKLVLFIGDSEPIWEWELPRIYDFAGPIFPPSDWAIDFDRWPE
ncbi:hypothetical protein IAD21_00932 [Abditibacteriota bacterium]|nr:hypothetical protein IAD21_00932 [Abditibacteriota bacterium]